MFHIYTIRKEAIKCLQNMTLGCIIIIRNNFSNIILVEQRMAGESFGIEPPLPKKLFLHENLIIRFRVFSTSRQQEKETVLKKEKKSFCQSPLPHLHVLIPYTIFVSKSTQARNSVLRVMPLIIHFFRSILMKGTVYEVWMLVNTMKPLCCHFCRTIYNECI